MNGGEITKEEAIELIHTSDDDTMILLAMADKIRQHFNDNSVDVCAIVNARDVYKRKHICCALCFNEFFTLHIIIVQYLNVIAYKSKWYKSNASSTSL